MPIRPATHRASGRARRAALLDAAVEVIAEQGVAGTTHRAIAARAGMSTSTTSYFFSSLDQLVAAALHLVGERIVQRVDAVTAQVADAELGPREAIDRFVDAVMSEPEPDTVAQFEIYLECRRRPQLQPTAHRIMASIERGAEASLQAMGIADAGQRAPMVVALLDGLALHRHVRPRAETDRRLITEALYSLHRGFVEADTEAGAGAEAGARRE
jgi:TetR/AcrR family transcriptional regulator, regulator of biofilm formation and stress response